MKLTCDLIVDFKGLTSKKVYKSDVPTLHLSKDIIVNSGCNE